MRAWIVALSAVLCLTACGKPASTGAAAPPALTAKAKSPDASTTASLPMLAYAYETELQVSKGNLPALLGRHRDLCQAAGPLQCQVTASELSSENGAPSGTLTFRAAPAWLANFRQTLDQDAKSAGGSVVRSEVTAEDLTHDIVDTDAVVKTKIALRDRLQALIASRPGKLSDLLDIERELARLQGEIDSLNANLAVMRQRVETSTLTIHYLAKGSGDGGADMIGQALGGAADASEKTVAMLITLFAVLAPIGVVVAAIALIVVYVKRRRSKGANTPPPPGAV